MVRLLDRAPDLDAVFAASDLMAPGALATLRAAERGVPDDVRMLLELIDGASEVTPVILRTTLIVRDSTRDRRRTT